ncbi:protein brambleberry [Aplysia californica]|uniref:Protein brambleberry n=1 Tax=Aplysia californica TaxID=6500 RepID=A0ABM0JTJ9_APLCA|nr:protein brambleberry [Aplysia californica]
MNLKHHCVHAFLLFTIIFCQPSSSVFEWLFGAGEGGEKAAGTLGGENRTPIRFEVLSSDEKFLDFAQTLTDLSPLDACYNIVIYSLKTKCGELSEEELGKLSVQLLNCQSEVEDRTVFPCTASMSLADCTKSMDGTTWNSYQIVGNRARAMCYATQQVQFRRLTEQTVNRLLGATSEQVKSLNELKDGQDQLHSLTAETVRKLYESQQDLLSTQHSLRDAHQDIFNHIASNVKEIMQEKALIASGNRELASMTENIREKLELTAEQIKQRESSEHKKHERILKDLKDIQDNTEASVRKLDNNLQRLLGKYEELDSQYGGLAENLSKMNGTITYLMASVTYMQKHLDDRINWISQLLDGADDKLSAMSCCLLHIAYFFLLAVTATFLQVSLPVRLAMMVVIVGNVAAELNYDHSLDFAGLTVFLCTLYFGFKLVVYSGRRFDRTRRYFSHSQGGTPQRGSATGSPLSSDEMRTLLDLLQRFSRGVSGHLNASYAPTANGTALRDTSIGPSRHNVGPSRHDDRHSDGHSDSGDEPVTPPATYASFLNSSSRLLDASRTELPTPPRRTVLDPLITGRGSRSSSRASTPVPRDSRSSTPSVSSRCLSNTVAGTQCRMPAAGGSDFCRRHSQSQR